MLVCVLVLLLSVLLSFSVNFMVCFGLPHPILPPLTAMSAQTAL